MNHNEDELQKELRNLKTSSSIDPQKKEVMKAAVRKHAQKKRKKAKLKQSAIWFSTIAALLIGTVLILNTINNNQSVSPADDHDQSEYNETMGEGGKDSGDGNEQEEPDNTTEPADDTQKSQDFSVSEHGTDTQTVLLEGTEEEETVTNFTLEPYGIQYQMSEFLGNYDVNADDGTVRHYSDAENAQLTLEVVEDASLDDVVSDIQTEYSDVAAETEEPADTPPGEENPYQGIGQHYSDPPQGYNIYQVEEDVLVIQYEYDIAAADGMGTRLLNFRESIN